MAVHQVGGQPAECEDLSQGVGRERGGEGEREKWVRHTKKKTEGKGIESSILP